VDFGREEEKRGDRLYEPGSGVDGISMDRKGAFKARMWFSIVIQESCMICGGTLSNRMKKEEKY
jgi:hypothetical protein